MVVIVAKGINEPCGQRCCDNGNEGSDRDTERLREILGMAVAVAEENVVLECASEEVPEHRGNQHGADEKDGAVESHCSWRVELRVCFFRLWFTGDARKRLTTASSETAEGGAVAAWWVCGEQLPCALLDICSRTIVAHFSAISVYQRILKRAPKNPQTLGEHLRLARIDRGLEQTELAQMLRVVYQTVEKWEHNLVPMSPKSRARVVALLGYDLAVPGVKPTADSIGD